MGIAYKLSCHRCGYESDLLYLGQGMAMLPEQIVGTCTCCDNLTTISINESYGVLMNPLMIFIKIIKLRWIHILSYDQMVSRKINNQTTRCANSIFYTTLFTNSAPNYT